jgi:hypothetical protein
MSRLQHNLSALSENQSEEHRIKIGRSTMAYDAALPLPRPEFPRKSRIVSLQYSPNI